MEYTEMGGEWGGGGGGQGTTTSAKTDLCYFIDYALSYC